MATFQAMIGTLKRELRSRQVRYRDIAQALQMSEANVKRMFSTGNLTTERVDQICSHINMDIADLVASHEAASQQIVYLEEAQEKELVSDINLLLVAVCVRNHLSFQEIVSEYNFKESECVRLLVRLDRMGLIELLPHNKIRLLVSEQFRWLRNGPIEDYFEKHMQRDFLNSRFSKDNEARYFLSGILSAAACAVLQNKLKVFAKEFEALYKEEVRISSAEKVNVGMYLAMRPWAYSEFEKRR